MPRSRKENAAYQYNHRDDHKELHNPLSNTFVVQYLHDARNHYPLKAQTARRYTPAQATRKGKNKHDLKAAEMTNKKFLQSKQTKPRFMNGKENTGTNN